MMTFSIWSQRISEVLEEFSNPEFQRRVWIEGKGPEVSSFDEAINKLLDDFDFKNFIELPEVKKHSQLKKSLQQVYDTVISITDEIMSDRKINIEFLDSAYWKSIVELTKKAKDELDQIRENA